MIERLESRLLLARIEGSTLILEGTYGNDRLIVSERDGNLIVRENEEVSQYPSAGFKDIYYGQPQGSDYIKINSHLPSTINSGEGDDTVIGGSGEDTINCGKGRNLIYGRGGNDKIDPGTGRDRIFGGPGDDIIDVQDNQSDTVNGGDGIDGGSFDPGLDHGAKIDRATYLDYLTGRVTTFQNLRGSYPEAVPPPMALGEKSPKEDLGILLRSIPNAQRTDLGFGALFGVFSLTGCVPESAFCNRSH